MHKSKIGELIGGRPLFSIHESASLLEASAILKDNNIGALAVLRQRKLVGIISERDIIARAIACGRDSSQTQVDEVMTARPKTIGIDDMLVDALETMLLNHFRHLPVVVGDAAIGMISMRDIPAENQFLYQRFRQSIMTPGVEAEAAINQHRQSASEDETMHVARGLQGVGWSFAASQNFDY